MKRRRMIKAGGIREKERRGKDDFQLNRAGKRVQYLYQRGTKRRMKWTSTLLVMRLLV